MCSLDEILSNKRSKYLSFNKKALFDDQQSDIHITFPSLLATTVSWLQAVSNAGNMICYINLINHDGSGENPVTN